MKVVGGTQPAHVFIDGGIPGGVCIITSEYYYINDSTHSCIYHTTLHIHSTARYQGHGAQYRDWPYPTTATSEFICHTSGGYRVVTQILGSHLGTIPDRGLGVPLHHSLTTVVIPFSNLVPCGSVVEHLQVYCT